MPFFFIYPCPEEMTLSLSGAVEQMFSLNKKLTASKTA